MVLNFSWNNMVILEYGESILAATETGLLP
jgi:hypothetical protein